MPYLMMTGLLFNGMRDHDAGHASSLQECNCNLELSFINKLLFMAYYHSKRLLALAVLLFTGMPAFAVEQTLPAESATCKRPDYPEQAQKAWEEGISMIGFLVRADGTVVNSVVLNSSGSRQLDRAAQSALSRCVFTRAPNIGGDVELWVRTAYRWYLDDDPKMLAAKQIAARSASTGNLPARYHLSLLLEFAAKSEEERAQALVVLRSAAELGHAHAQFDLGRRHELGKGVEANLDEALRWYRKAAEQGDPLAKQRLALGILPN